MPRVKQNDDVMELELRITPPDGEPITDWKLTDDHREFVAYVEGGADTGKTLHYHCYLKYARSRTLLLKWIYSIAHCNNGETGNAVFFSRKPHDHTFGYIAKCGSVACRHNVPQTTLDEWFAASEGYRKSKSSARKRSQRTREQLVADIKDHIITELKEHRLDRNVQSIVDRLLAEFNTRGLSFPPRASLEILVMNILYHFDPSYVRSFYARNLLGY